MIAVLGLGSIGMRHAANALALGRPVIGFDPSPERRALLERAGGTAVAERRAALAAARAAVIASPSEHHLDDLAAAVAAGCHVLVEKPLAHRIDGIAALLDDADATGRVVAVAMMLRLHPAVVRARTLLADGALGRPLWGRFLAALYLPDWRPGQDWRQGYANDPRTGGALFDYIHEIDLAAHLLGPARALACVAGRSETLGLASEDVADVVLDHPGAVRSAIHVDYVTRPRRREAEIAGTGGLLRLDLDRRRLTRWDVAGEVVEDTTFPGTYADDYVEEMRQFLAATRGEVPPACPCREALAVLDCLISARTLAGLPS